MFSRRLFQMTWVLAAWALLAAGFREPAAGQDKRKLAAEVLNLKNKQEVGRTPTLEGRLVDYDGKCWPVVLVQPVVEGEPWYVQNRVTGVDKTGGFKVQINIGGDKTKPGTEFRVVVIVAKDRAQANRQYKPESKLDTLPADLPASKEITVIRK